MNKQAAKIVLSLLVLLPTARADAAGQTVWKNASLGDWFIATNWNNNTPDSSTDAVISNGGTALVTAPGANAQYIFLGVGGFQAGLGTLTIAKPGAGAPGGLNANSIFVGRANSGVAGTGALNVSGGGLVTLGADGELNVGVFSDGPSGSVNVTDPGSSISAPHVKLGNDTGHGTLTIQNGAAVYCSDASIAGTPALVGTSSATGAATVTGVNSLWSISGAVAPVNVGYNGNGSLSITNGGLVSAQSSTIATLPGSNGAVTVTGTGSLWDNSGGNMYVSGSGASSASGGAGVLHILSGGRVQAALLKVFSPGFVEVNNGSTNVPGLVAAGDFLPHVSGGALGDLAVGNTSGGRMEISTGGAVANQRGYIGGNSGSDGAVLVTGVGSQSSLWENGGSIWVGNAGNGTLEVRDGGAVTSAGNGYIAFSTNTTGYAVVSGQDSIWTTAVNLYVGGNGAGPGGSGTLQIENGGIVSATATTVYDTGFLQLAGDFPYLESALTLLGGKIQALSDMTFLNNFSLGTEGGTVYTTGFKATLSGVISGVGGLTKGGTFTGLGPGTLTLTGSNTYSGGTAISFGRLLVNNSVGSGTGTGSVSVSSGSTLGGTGSIGGPVTVNSGGILLGGNGTASNGSLTMTNDVAVNSGAIVQLVLGPSGAHSTVSRTGGIWTIPSNLRFSFINAGAQPGVYDNIITGLAGAPGTEGSWTIISSGFIGTFSYDGDGNIDLNLTAAPTPPLTGCDWTNGPTYPIPVLDNSATTVGAALYSFGGVSNGTVIADSYKLDGATWTSIAPLPEPLEKPAVVSDGAFAYIIGGVNGDGTVRNTLYRYDPTSNTYTALTSSSVATWASSADFLNGKLYKIGGILPSGTTNAVEVYNIAANTWAPAASYALSLGYISSFVRNGFVYGAGGVDFTGAGSAKTYRYDPAANTWSDSAIADLPEPRWGAACVRYNGVPLLAGGVTTSDIATSVIGWVASSNTWSYLPDLIEERSRATGAVLNGTFCVIGGRSLADDFTGSDINQQLTCLAPTFTVTTLADHDDGVCETNDCTLREAINAANILANDDSTLISFAPDVIGEIQLTAVLPNLSSNIDMRGPGANQLTVRRNTGGSYRIFNITPGSAVVRISGLTIANGNAAGVNSGGGLFNSGTLTLTNAAVSGNSAFTGGGIFNDFGGTLTITGSTLSGNSGTGLGAGGVFNNGTIKLTNSTISGNTASGNGGGIAGGTVVLTNSTISGNTASGNGGGIFQNGSSGGSVTSKNTIIALNTAPGGPDFSGPLISDGFNLIGNNSGATITPTQPSDHIGTPVAPLDPLLGPLQSNGGPTMTMALLSGSPCINAGDPSFTSPPDFDQRGMPFVRVYGGQIDIGAYELSSVPPDFDHDGDVDADDLNHLRECTLGAGVPQNDPTCADARLDGDDDVDMDDFSILQRCYSGAGHPANPNCAGMAP